MHKTILQFYSSISAHMSPRRPLVIAALTALTASLVGLAVLLLYRQKRGDTRRREDSQSETHGDARRREDSQSETHGDDTRKSHPEDSHQSQQRAVEQWLAKRDVSLPSVAAVLRAINNSRTNKRTLVPSEEVCSLLVIASLLSPPHFSHHVSTERERIEIGTVVTRHTTACLHPSRSGVPGGHRYHGMIDV